MARRETGVLPDALLSAATAVNDRGYRVARPAVSGYRCAAYVTSPSSTPAFLTFAARSRVTSGMSAPSSGRR